MADTTIKVDSEVRDRLAALAAERGLTIRDLVSQVAAAIPTRAELTQRRGEAADYVRAHLRPGFDAGDVEAGEELWRSITAAPKPGTPESHQQGNQAVA